jgi:flagellar assembly factor FliW
MRSNDCVVAATKIPVNEYPGRARNAGESLEGDLVEQQLFFPVGILGFPRARHYRLQRYRPEDGSESPFFTLSCTDQDLSFAVIAPGSLGLDYRMQVSDGGLDILNATAAEKLVTLLIVTVRERIEDITVNLQGPLVINPASSLGLQLVLEQYPLRYPLVQTAAK